jgi:transposase
MEGAGPKRLEAMGERIEALRCRNWQLQQDLAASRGALFQARQRIGQLEQELDRERESNRQLQEHVSALHEAVKGASVPAAVPSFVKANVPERPRKKPGRKAGHAAAHRPLPVTIDEHIEVPLPYDGQQKASCPECHAQLSDVQKHARLVEDIVLPKLWVKCYHTTSGYCPGCRRIIESRAPEQPPAPPGVDLPQGQLGLNALAAGALLRMQYRLPFRQITQLFLDLPGLPVSSGAVAQQVQRMGGWLEGEYDRLKALLRASPVVHMDETGWRTDGHNGWLWTMLSDQHTVYHVDQSRGQKVVANLLGETFAGTLVSDFYSGYGKIDCGKQKCLVHLLRELHETAQKHPAFADGRFYLRCRRLVKQMLLLKKKKAALAAGLYEAKVKRLERRVLELIGAPGTQPQALRLTKRLKRHRGELTHFLWHDEVDGTNNAAERAIRPLVVARKISGGSRSDNGARATAILMSVLRTAVQQNRPLLETIKALLTASWAGKNPGLLTDILQP